MAPWLGLEDAGHRLKSLFTTCLSRSFTLRWRKRDHKRANNRDAHNVQGLKPNLDAILSIPGALSTQPPAQFVPNNPFTIVQPSSLPIILESAQPTTTPSPTPIYILTGSDPLTHGRSNPPLPLTVHTETGVAHGTQAQGVLGTDTRTDTRLELNPIPTSDVPITTGSGSVVDSGCLTARPPRARALLIGVHYNKKPGGWAELTTPGKDVREMRKLLRSRGYKEFRTLVDTNDPYRDGMPTEQEICKGLHWLIEDARAGDKLFLHYSGHGTQEETTDSSETDGMNEAIVTLGNTPNSDEKYILDNELHRILVKPLPENCTLMAIFDCCHSGTMLDLSHKYPQLRLTRRNLPKLWMKEVIGRLVRPDRKAHSLPVTRRPSPTIEGPAPEADPHRQPSIELVLPTPSPAPKKAPTKPQRNPTRKGTANPLALQYIFAPSDANANGADGPQPFGPPQLFAFGELNGSPAQSLMHPPPTNIFTIEPDSRRSTQNSMQRCSTPSSMQIGIPSRHSTVPGPTPPHSGNGTGTVGWFACSLTSTPKKVAFDHEETTPPVVKDFQTQTRAHSQVKSPTLDEPHKPLATIIVIAACHDDEEAIDFDNTGGLLTSTFIECMKNHREGLSLGEMVTYLRGRFEAETDTLHANCPKVFQPKDGNCIAPNCGMPIKAPEPLVTSSIKMMGDTRIVL